VTLELDRLQTQIAPAHTPKRGNETAQVAVLYTSAPTVVPDIGRAMRLAGLTEWLPREVETILKINISWQHYYPACSTTPWQLDGVIRCLRDEGYRTLIPAHNGTVPGRGCVGARGEAGADIDTGGAAGQDGVGLELTAGAVAGQFRRRLSSQPAARANVDPAAYELYLQGRFYWNQRNERSLKLALDYFHQALARAPDYAGAWSAMADAYAALVYGCYRSPAEGFSQARAALELKPHR